MNLHFTVPAVPVAQPRPRATVRAGHAAVYEAKSGHAVHAFKASVRMAATGAYSGAPLTGPLWVQLRFVFPRPRSMFWKKRPMPRDFHAKKPDADNCIKSVLDALNGTLYLDDSQIADCRIEKWIASGDEQPCVEVFMGQLS